MTLKWIPKSIVTATKKLAAKTTMLPMKNESIDP